MLNNVVFVGCAVGPEAIDAPIYIFHITNLNIAMVDSVKIEKYCFVSSSFILPGIANVNFCTS